MKQLNSSAVNVSWTRFDSEDVFYRVYYSSPPGQADFPGNSSWGVIHRLQPGQTQFQVAAIAVIQGIQTEGQRSDVIATTGRQVTFIITSLFTIIILNITQINILTQINGYPIH